MTIGNWKQSARVNYCVQDDKTGIWSQVDVDGIDWYILHQGTKDGDFLLLRDKDEAVKVFMEEKRFKNILGGVYADNYRGIKLSRTLFIVCRERFFDRQPFSIESLTKEKGRVIVNNRTDVYGQVWPFEDVFVVTMVLSEDCSRWERKFKWV